MNVGLFAMLAGFLLPLALVIRLGWMATSARWRGLAWGHPLVWALLMLLALAAVPPMALAPSAWHVVSGHSIEDGAVLLDFTATRWGLAKLALNVIGVLGTDLMLPRFCEQLQQPPISTRRPTRAYLLRDLGVLAVCLLLALAAAVDR